VSTCSFAAAADELGGVEGESEGVGPIFNNDGCGTCHFTPALGGSSQVTEKRAGFFDGTTFFEHPGGSLIQDRSLYPAMRTPPLWGLRLRGRFMHDGQSLTPTDAIRRHGNQGDFARDAFNALSQTNKNNLLAFLNSL
jgi:CxxC motif-containing protein (DUF1111 family)